MKVGSLAAFHFDDEFVAALTTAVLADQQIDVLFRLSRQKQSTDFRPALWKLQLLKKLAFLVQEGQASILRKGSKLEEGSH